MLKEVSYAEKKRPHNQKQEIYKWKAHRKANKIKQKKKKKRKGKIVKVGNNPYTNVISKPEVTRRGEHKFKKL